MLGRSPSPNRKALWGTLAIAAATWCVVVAAIFGHERATLWAIRDEVTTSTRPADPFRKFQVPGIVRPSAVEAGASRLRDDEEVIGVEVDGRARAYRLDALRDRSRHLVNDVIGDLPVTVAYCDLDNCARAYTGPGGRGPLEVSVGGLYQGRELVLELHGSLYSQRSGAPLESGTGRAAIPLDRLEPTRTTWREWKRLHPSTDVYEGRR